MSIKTILLKKKLEKTASPMELFVAQNLYQVMEQLIEATHGEETAKLQAEITAFTNDFFVKFKNLGEQIASSIDSDTTAKKNETIQAIAKMMVELSTFKTDCLTKIDEHNRAVTAQADAKVARILNNIEDFRGPQGFEGKIGAKGVDGSPDTPEQIITKVNKAGGVKMTAIEGLSETIKAVKKAGGGKSGGGMGNMQHETKSVGSATTSVTTTYGVAAGGRAIWVYYQGQGLAYGTHFTVSGKTITLLFTPVDSTALDIIYVRA
jgi:hypothetical protein